jgi:processing peptidase subunit beta
VPESLKYTREQKRSELDNGVRVVSEEVAGHLVAVNLTVKTGSRDETLDTSGVN